MNGDSQSKDGVIAARVVPKVASTGVTVGGVTRDFSLFDTIISRTECAKILQGKSYPLMLPANLVQSVVDIGANIGAATLYFALHYPTADIYSLEPDPVSYVLLQRNTEDLANVSIFNFGLSDEDRQAPLFLGQIDPATNSLRHSSLNSTDAITVSLKEPQTVFREHAIEVIDILKIDTEGN